MTTNSILLKSWAMPPVSWPTASIFCICRMAPSASIRRAVRRAISASSSSRERASTSRASTRSWITVQVPNQRLMRPSASRTGCARPSTQR